MELLKKLYMERVEHYIEMERLIDERVAGSDADWEEGYVAGIEYAIKLILKYGGDLK